MEDEKKWGKTRGNFQMVIIPARSKHFGNSEASSHLVVSNAMEPFKTVARKPPYYTTLIQGHFPDRYQNLNFKM